MTISIDQRPAEMNTSLEARDLTKEFRARRGRKGAVRALDGVSLTVVKGRTVAVVGQSGSGKTTLGRIFCGLEKPTTGTLHLDGQPLGAVGSRRRAQAVGRIQTIFQDPYASLDPRFTIGASIMESLRYGGTPKDALRERMLEALDRVGLQPSSDYADRHPHSLSGGQRQRVAIARATAIMPDFIIADEPVSMLDVSLQAGILNLLGDLQRDLNCGYLFITHDLAVARHVADTIAVMQNGRIVEIGERDQVIEEPRHEYTKLLLKVGRG